MKNKVIRKWNKEQDRGLPILFFGVSLFFIAFLLTFHISGAAFFSWVQTLWIGEATSTTAVYSNNYDSWINYSSSTNIGFSSKVSTTSLVSYWSFDGDVNDDFGSNNGTASGSPTYATSTKGQAILLDGNDDYVEVLGNTDLDLTASFTISAWVKKGESNRYQTIIDKGSYKLGIDSNDQAYFSVIGSSSSYVSGGSGPSNARYPAAAVYNGKYYLSGWHGQVGYYNGGTSWVYAGTPVPGEPAGNGFNNSLTVFNEKLYDFAYLNGNNGNAWRYDGGTSWTPVRTSGSDVLGSIVYEGKLYMVSGYYIRRYDGGETWTVVSGSFGTNTLYFIVYNGNLYVGGNNGLVYRYDGGTTWTTVLDLPNYRVIKMAVYDNKLYLQLNSGNCDIYSYNGTDAVLAGNIGGTSCSNGYGDAMAVYNGKLYTGVNGVLYRYDGGTTWTNVGSSGNANTHSVSAYDGKLFTGHWGLVYIYGSGKSVYSGSTIGDDYTQISASFDGSVLKMYVDGVLAASSSWSGLAATNSLPLLIGNSYGSTEGGGYNSSGEENFKGFIDEVRLYNTVLSSEDILGNYRAEKYGEESLFLTSTSSSLQHTSDSDFSGTVENLSVINNNIILDYIGGTNDTSSYGFPATSTVIYRSVGAGSVNEIASGTSEFTLSIASSGEAVFSGGSLPDNIGVGDAIIYDIDSNDLLDSSDAVLFVHYRTDNQNYILRTESGTSTISNTTSGNDTWAVYRAYTSLAEAESGTVNASIPVAFDTWSDGRDLVANGEVWNIACYGDATDTTAVSISGWTTATSTFLRIFTPYLSSEVGESQRHSGVWDDSKYNIKIDTSNTVINIATGNGYIRIEGLQVQETTVDDSGRYGIYSADGAIGLVVSNNIVREGNVAAVSTIRSGIYLYVEADAPNYIFNNIVYGFSAGRGINIRTTNGNEDTKTFIYNNTAAYCDIGIMNYSTGATIKNNLAYGNDKDYSGPWYASSANNAYASGTAPVSGSLNISSYASTTIFIDPENGDFRLRYSSPVLEQGADLSADSDLAFAYDIGKESRPSNSYWDIGADEYAGYIATGTYISPIIQVKNRFFDIVNWTTTNATGTSLKFRTGTSSDMADAPDWSDCYEFWNGLDVSNAYCVNDKDPYLQYRLQLSVINDQSFTPTFSDISLNYSNYNSAGALVSSPFDWENDEAAMSSLSWLENLSNATNLTASIKTANSSSSLDIASWGQISRGDCSIVGGSAACDYSALPASSTDGVDDRYSQYRIDLSSEGFYSPVLQQFTLTAAIGGSLSIYNVASTTGAATATISWDTNIEATSTLEYGTTTAYGQATSSDISTTNHSFTIGGLDDSTTYHFKISAGSGEEFASSSGFTFTTLDITTPSISEAYAFTTSTSTTITWRTNEVATSTLYYGERFLYDHSYDPIVASTSFSVTLSDLVASSSYHFKVLMEDGSNNSGYSADFPFVTAVEDLGLNAYQAGWLDQNHIRAIYNWADDDQLLDWATVTDDIIMSREGSVMTIDGSISSVRAVRWKKPMAVERMYVRQRPTSRYLNLYTNLTSSWASGSNGWYSGLGHIWSNQLPNGSVWIRNIYPLDSDRYPGPVPVNGVWNNFEFLVSPTEMRAWSSINNIWYSRPGTYTSLTDRYAAIGAWNGDTSWEFVLLDGEVNPDTVKPVISSVSSSTSVYEATITWSTDEISTSSVEYGLTSAYGNSSSSDLYFTGHSLVINGLEQNTQYHFKVYSTDQWGNTGSSTDYTFTTITADGIAPEITSFEIPGISSSTAITVNFTASDNIGVTGYLITETSTTPSLSDPRWETTPTTTYIFSGSGRKTLYAWARDFVGNISSSPQLDSFSESVLIDTAAPTINYFSTPLLSTSTTISINEFEAADNSLNITWSETQPAGNTDQDWFTSSMSADGSTIIAGDYGGRLYMSTTSGATWSETQPAENTDQAWFTSSMSADGSIIIVGVDEGRLYLSTNSGETWSEVQPAGGFDQYWYSSAISANGSIVAAGNYGGRFYVSTTSGATWSEVQPAGNTEQLWLTSSMSADGSIIIAGVEGGRLYMSTTSGETWSEVQPAGNTEQAWRTSAMSADGSTIIAGIVAGRLYMSTTSGETWSEVQPAGDVDKFWNDSAISADGSIIIAGAEDSPLYFSANHGETWSDDWPNGNWEIDKDWQTSAMSADGSIIIAGIRGDRLYLGLNGLHYLLSESSSTPSISDSAWQFGTPSSYTFSSDGEKTLYAFVMDNAENISLYASSSITVDTTAPVVTEFIIPEAFNSLTIPITFTASDNINVAGYLITETAATPSLLNPAWESSPTTTYTFATNGTKTLYAWAKDDLGNISSSVPDTVFIDIFSPIVTDFEIQSISSSTTVSINNLTAIDTFNWNEIRLSSGVNASGTGYAISMSADGSTLVVGDSSGRLYVSTDYGDNWNETQPAGDTYQYWFASSMSSSGSIILAGAAGGRLYLSTNTGTSWSEVQPAGDASNTWSVSSMSADGSIILAGAIGGRLYLSTNTGASWSEVQPAGDASNTWSVSSMSADGSIILAGARGGRLYLSTNTGASWSEVQPAGDTDQQWVVSSMSADGSTIIAGAYEGGFYYSANTGSSWFELSPTGNSAENWSLSAMSADGLTIFTGIFGGRLYRDLDDDSSSVAGYLISEASSTPEISDPKWEIIPTSSYTFVSAGNKTLYAWAKDSAGNISASATADVLIDLSAPVISAFDIQPISSSTTVNINELKATDDNITIASWSAVDSLGSGDWRTSSMSTDGSIILSGAYNGRLYLSTTTGDIWSEVRPAGDFDKNWQTSAISADGTKIIAGVYNGRFYMSTTSGETWSEIRPIGDTDQAWQTSAMSADGSTIIAGAYNGRLYLSTNFGETWSEVQPAGIANKGWASSAISADGSIIVAGIAGYEGGVYISTNSGSSWSEIQSVDSGWSSADISDDGSVIVIADSWTGTFYLSTNLGSSWSEITPTSIPYDYLSLASVSKDGSIIFATANQRLYFSTNTGATWSEVQPAGDVDYTWQISAISSDGSVVLTAEYDTNFYLAKNGPRYLLSEFSSTPSISDPAWQFGAPSSYTFSSDGEKILYAFAMDNAENISLYASSTVSIDAFAPVVTEFIIPETYNSLIVPITSFVATDTVAVAGYLINQIASTPSLSDSAWEITPTTTYTFLTQGTKTLYAWAKDDIGNISLSSSDTVIIDISSPIISDIATSSVATTTATITFTTNENATSTVYYGTTASYGFASSSDISATSHTINLSGLTASTTYHFMIETTDSFGNTSTSSDYTFVTSGADNEAPTITAFSIPETSSSTTIAINLTAEDNVGVTGYLITETSAIPSLSDPHWETTPTSTYTFVDDGTKTLYAWAKDAAGNISSSSSDTVIIDTSAPTISNIASSTDVVSAAITFTTNENAFSTVYYGTTASYGLASSTSAAAVSHTINLSGLEMNTSYHYMIEAIDGFGNISTSSDYIFTTSNYPAPTPIYRSVGPNNANELASGTVTALLSIDSYGIATFNGITMPDRVGVGDAIVYDKDGDNDIDAADEVVFIHRRSSSTEYIVKNQAGLIPTNTTSANDVWAVYRAYTSLANAEASTNNASIIPAYDTWSSGRNLTAATGANEIWNIACYGDAVDTTAVSISGWTTSEDNFIRIYTPTSTAEVGISQRHRGVWDDGKYNIKISSSNSVINMLSDSKYIHIDGLQLQETTVDAGSRYCLSSQEGVFGLKISNNIIKEGNMSAVNINRSGMYLYLNNNAPNYIYNNLIYNFFHGRGIHIRTSTGAEDVNTFIYSNTVVGCDDGIYEYVGSGNVIKNNLTFGNNNDYEFVWAASSTNNAYSEGTDPGSYGLNISTYASSSIFISPNNNDFRLRYNSPVINMGANLSADEYLSFINDIEGQSRSYVSSWDVGADEFDPISDIFAPIISNIATSSIATTTAAITFTTNENATSTVYYGTTASYGFASSSDISATSHTINLSGLTASTTYHFMIETTDSFGNTSTSSDYTFVTSGADNEAPTITAFSIPETSSSTTIAINFTAEDNVAVTGYLVTDIASIPELSDPDWRAIATTTYTFADDGTKTLYAWAKDAAGNISDSSSDTVIIDILAPTISNIASSTEVISATITFTTNENAFSTVYYGTTTSYGLASSTSIAATSHTINLSNLEMSTNYHYMIEVIDSFGNISTSSDYTFQTIDGESPVVTEFIIPETYNSLIVPITSFVATDTVAVAGYLINQIASTPSLSDSAWEITPTTTYTFLTQGTKTLYAWAKDAAGNISDSFSDTIIIDISAPIVSNIASSTNSVTSTITFTTNENATSTIYYGATAAYGFASSSDISAVSHTINLSGLTASTTYHFMIETTDSFGNISTSSDYIFTTTGGDDGIAPTVISFIIPSVSSSTTIMIADFAADDNINVTGYIITESPSVPELSDSRWETTPTSSYAFISQGSKVLYSWARDAAGNISSYSSAPVIIDIDPPNITGFEIPASASSLTVSISLFTAEDSLSGVSAYLLSESEETPSLSDSGWLGDSQNNYTFSSQGIKSLYAWVRDAAGNISSSSVGVVDISIAESSSARTVHGIDGIYFSAPVEGGFSVSINNDAATTTERTVWLTFETNGQKIDSVQVSETGDFSGVIGKAYINRLPFTVSETQGLKKIYVRLWFGNDYSAGEISDTIYYQINDSSSSSSSDSDSRQSEKSSTTSSTTEIRTYGLGEKDEWNEEIVCSIESLSGEEKTLREEESKKIKEEIEKLIDEQSFGEGLIRKLKRLSMENKLSGRLLLQVEENGEAWYLNPVDKKRYFLARPADMFNIMKQFGLGASHEYITETEIFPQRLSGRILIDVGDLGKAYYINPVDRKKYYLACPSHAFYLIKKLGLGISNEDIGYLKAGLLEN